MIVDRTEITNGKLKRQQVFSLPVIYTIHDDRNFAEKHELVKICRKN